MDTNGYLYELLTVACILFCVCFIFFITFFVSRYRRVQEEFFKEKKNLQHEKELLSTQVEIQEQTLEKVSQEIHDNIGQTLSFVNLNINSIDLDQRSQTEAKLSQSKELIVRAIQDLRNLSKILSADFVQAAGLKASIQYQLDYLQKTGIYETRLIVSAFTYPLITETEMITFRVIQELLNNAVKHANATLIEVELQYTQKKLEITVRDNGKGFDKSELHNNPRSKGLGLSNMEKRLAPIGGSIDIVSKPRQGTTARIEVPELS
ncbi:MAG: ATP-binding protein [Niastella sp.]|nr:ATP-binding protein [Niastella sp.]